MVNYAIPILVLVLVLVVGTVIFTRTRPRGRWGGIKVGGPGAGPVSQGDTLLHPFSCNFSLLVSSSYC